ncbi:signal transducer and activator of transcription 5B-like isoform X2 [Liolophura sinensis]
MASWSLAQQLPADTLRRIYGPNFPLEVRHVLAQWIEKVPWAEINLNTPGHEGYARQLLDEMLMKLEKTCNDLGQDNFLLKMKLGEAATQFMNMYTSNPFNLVRAVKNCLDKERIALQQTGNAQMNSELASQSAVEREIMEKLEFLQSKTHETENDLRVLQEKQEGFIIQYEENVKLSYQLQQIQNLQPNNPDRERQIRHQKAVVESDLSRKLQELLQLRVGFAQKHDHSFNLLQEVQNKVINDELVEWKRKQQLAGIGVPFDGSLDNLQQWCESLAEILWQNRQQLKKLDMLQARLPIDLPAGQVNLLPKLDTAITGLLSSLVTSTFIVENQPPQVLKKDSRFTATVRLLVGGKLNVHMNPLKVEASIISEAQARSLLESERNNARERETSGEILNHSGTMEYQQATGQLSITFRNMQLKRIKRAERRGAEVHAVTEDKFSILFQSSFDLGGGELLFRVWTLSLPVVVTVHGNQECNALATVMWDNAFSQQGRIPFQVPDKVQWPMVADMLQSKFKSFVGVNLTQENLNYLASKVFGGTSMEDYSTRTITWSQFNKEPIAARTFTFWEWFYAILKLSKEHLKEPWGDGSIGGFIGKSEAQEWLMSKENGTFLLRFSDSEIGGITIAWVAEDNKTPSENSRQVWNLAPYTAKDFAIRSLADRIKDLPNLVYLYPHTPKDDAFSKYYTTAAEPKARDGYIPSKLVNKIEDIPHSLFTAAPLSPDNPQTPQPIGAQSPSSEYGNPLVYSMHPMETPNELMLSGLMDYNPDDIVQIDDIDRINVSELLAGTNNGMHQADIESMMQH